MSEFEPMFADMILPAAFSSRMRTLLGNEYEAFDAALHTAPQVSLRLNPSKGVSSPSYSPVPWCREAYYLDTRPAFTFDPLLHAGAYYVQEASSMFLDFLLRRLIDKPVRYLDLCAAPGGKSTLALSALPAGSLLICNEVVRTRTSILTENLMKWGSDNLIVTRNSAADFGALRHYFDLILVDAPCSGEGMFRKEEQAVAEWSPARISHCADRQREILSSVWEALSPGGLLLYSTCTYNREENEEIGTFLVRRLQAEPLCIETPPEWHISPSFDATLPAYRFFPHRTRGEGLFMMVLRKPGNPEERKIEWLGRDVPTRSKGKRGRKRSSKEVFPFPTWLAAPERYVFTVGESGVVALPATRADEMTRLADHLDVVYQALPVALRKGTDWQPHPALALSAALRSTAFETLPLSLDEAIAYLRRETLPVSPDNRRGIRLVTYKGHPLGWCNCVGNRINNLYPPEWRIRSGYRPETLNLPL